MVTTLLPSLTCLTMSAEKEDATNARIERRTSASSRGHRICSPSERHVLRRSPTATTSTRERRSLPSNGRRKRIPSGTQTAINVILCCLIVAVVCGRDERAITRSHEMPAQSQRVYRVWKRTPSRLGRDSLKPRSTIISSSRRRAEEEGDEDGDNNEGGNENEEEDKNDEENNGEDNNDEDNDENNENEGENDGQDDNADDEKDNNDENGNNNEGADNDEDANGEGDNEAEEDNGGDNGEEGDNEEDQDQDQDQGQEDEEAQEDDGAQEENEGEGGEEDGDDDAEEENDEGEGGQEDDADADDNNEGDNDNNNGGDDEEGQDEEDAAGDDFYDDYGLADYYYDDEAGYYGDDDPYWPRVDDFYAFEEDPGPPRLLPMKPRTILAYLIAAMAMTLGASGGLGGGGIVGPIYILVMGLPLRAAIPVGAVTVLGGAIVSTILNLPRRHPLADRPIIDWDLVLVMEPLTLVGTLLGTLFHRLLSEKFLVVLLVLLLSVIAHTTLNKAMRMYQAEKRYIRHLIAAQAEPPQGSPHRAVRWSEGSTSPAKKRSRYMGVEEKQQILIQNPDFVTLRSDMLEAEKVTPGGKIVALVCIFSIVIFLNIMVGGGGFKSPWDIQCGLVAFWVVHVIMIAFLIASAWAAQTYLVARHEIKEMVRFDYVHGDIKWNTRSAIIYPAVFITAGLFAGTLGIGGGVITVPIMLAMGVHPAVASATSSTQMLFTSITSTTSYFVFGLILFDFAVVGFVVGFLATITGQFMMRRIRVARSASGQNFERNSYIAFATGGAVLVSALLMTLQYVFWIVGEPDHDSGGLCDGLRI